jgi:C1A family cysteine protease
LNGDTAPGRVASAESRHAIVNVTMTIIRNTNAGGLTTKGALLIRNSWGTGWGQAGYG